MRPPTRQFRRALGPLALLTSTWLVACSSAPAPSVNPDEQTNASTGEASDPDEAGTHEEGSPIDQQPLLADKVELLAADSPEAEAAGIADALKAPGLGGVTQAFAVRLTEDMPVYRLWSGPDQVDANGNTNRLGQWWGFDPLAGSVADYRSDYAVCEDWNELTWAVSCTLRAGAVVVTGPGQSVSEELCANPGESYDASETWQVYILQPWTRVGEGGDLDCPEDNDYAVDPEHIDVAPKPE